MKLKPRYLALIVLAGLCATMFGADAPVVIPTPKNLNVESGERAISQKGIISYASEDLAPLAKILRDDIACVHGVRLNVASGTSGTGDIVLRLVKGDPQVKGLDAYRVVVGRNVVVEGDNYNAVALGMMTVLQTLKKQDEGLSIPKMTVVDDADRRFRAVQLCIKNHYHTLAWVKRAIDLLRFYKIRLLELHTAESMWIGCVMNSVTDIPEKERRRTLLWTKAEMEDVIAYAKARGVFLFPHNESVPHYGGMKKALTQDFNTTDTFKGFMDEIDGKGPYVVEGSIAKDGDPRYWAFMKEVTQRSYKQFAAGWPDGKLPYYHIGPVYGEGGTTPENAVRLLTFLKEKNPDIKLMYWCGPSTQDPVLAPHRKNILGCYYCRPYGAAPEQLFKGGAEIVNVSGEPLYFAVGSVSPRAARQNTKRICEDFHMARLTGENFPQYANQVTGAMLPTWEMRQEGHIEALVEGIPFFAEHVWNIRPFPYPADLYETMSARYFGNIEVLAKQLVCEPRPPSPTRQVTATKGIHPDRVTVLWAAGDNFPEYYKVYRAEENDPAKAKVVSRHIPASSIDQVNRFDDKTASPGKHYFYWVKDVSVNGASEFSDPAEGYKGNTPAVIARTYEPFDYTAGTAVTGADNGVGWADAWTETNVISAAIGFTGESLTYPGLKTQGGRLVIRKSAPRVPRGKGTEPYMSVTRTLAADYGAEGTEVWMSYLLKGTSFNNITFGVRFGKSYMGFEQFDGGRFRINDVSYPEKIETGRTYLLVTRHVFHAGNDLVHCWLDPEVGKRPSDEDAITISRKVDNNVIPKQIKIGMYAYNVLDFDIDEIRIGGSYEEVTPGVE